ncbi:MAG TPA: hypothetical protein VN325_38140 [Steroidobacteraceae bacterium]|nr:hypothetical protein [Steroidobacteraceae bacterium]
MVSSGSPYAGKSRLYALADPEPIVREADRIASVLRGLMGVREPAGCVVAIAQTGAWMRASLKNEVWTRQAPPALPSSTDAKATATKFLQNLEKACSPSNSQWPQTLADYMMIPPVAQLNLCELIVVPRADGSAWDHWLYRAEPQLLVDGAGTTRIGVFGAHLELRIGDGGRVVDFVMRWRALTRERHYAQPLPYTAATENSGNEDLGPLAAAAQLPPVQGYLLEGDGIPQYYLAPYWFKSDGHSVSPISASDWSLTVDIGRVQQGDETMTVMALAQGGSGQYDYRWAVYRYDAILSGYQQLTGDSVQSVDSANGRATSSEIELQNGIWVAMVNVRDRVTGAFKHHQQLVFSSPFSSTSGGSELPVA